VEKRSASLRPGVDSGGLQIVALGGDELILASQSFRFLRSKCMHVDGRYSPAQKD